MGTRCLITIEDSHGDKFTIYRHWDGYPEAILGDLQKALPFAWSFPRFESDEFAAALVSAWKTEAGNIRLMENDCIPSDIEWLYAITFEKGDKEPTVRVFDWYNGKTAVPKRIMSFSEAATVGEHWDTLYPDPMPMLF